MKAHDKGSIYYEDKTQESGFQEHPCVVLKYHPETKTEAEKVDVFDYDANMKVTCLVSEDPSHGCFTLGLSGVPLRKLVDKDKEKETNKT